MRVSDMLAAMRTTKRRELVGNVVRDEIARMGKSHAWAADAMGMAPSTLARILKGDDRVTDVTLRSVEGPLGLADHLLSYVAAGDRHRIEQVGEDEIRPGLRRVILQALEVIEAEGLSDDTEGGASREAK